MANMNHCRACQRPYYLHEDACPFCGVAAPGGRAGRYVRRAKVGGLMLFTALTTAACYGAPPPPGALPKNSKPGVEQPLTKMPTTPGTAYLFVTAKGKPRQGSTLQLAAAVLADGTLTIKEGATGGGLVPADPLSITIEAADAAAFEPPAKNEAYQPLPVEKMKRLELSAAYTTDLGRKAILEVKLPGASGVEGLLQLSQLQDDSVGGVLRIDYADTLIELYFLAAR